MMQKTENGHLVYLLKGSKDEYIRLVYAANTNIRRHTKVISEVNPFDEKWQDYFVEREEHRMRNNLKGKKKLIKIQEEQKRILCSMSK